MSGANPLGVRGTIRGNVVELPVLGDLCVSKWGLLVLVEDAGHAKTIATSYVVRPHVQPDDSIKQKAALSGCPGGQSSRLFAVVFACSARFSAQRSSPWEPAAMEAENIDKGGQLQAWGCKH